MIKVRQRHEVQYNCAAADLVGQLPWSASSNARVGPQRVKEITRQARWDSSCGGGGGTWRRAQQFRCTAVQVHSSSKHFRDASPEQSVPTPRPLTSS